MVFFGIGLAHLTNTGKGKNKNLVDPNVHLLYIYPRHLLGTPSIVMMLKQQDSSCTNNDRQRVVFIEMTDTIVLQQMISNPGTDAMVQKTHILDCNHCLGCNPKSTQELDTVDMTIPYLQLISFGYKGQHSGE
jgi:hypothetical protein